jgi:hypothetical protein
MTHRHKVHVMRRRQARASRQLARPAKSGVQPERRWLRAPADGPLEDARGVVYLPEVAVTSELGTPPPAAA